MNPRRQVVSPSREELVYFSERALELATMAEDLRFPMLALLFRMASLEALGVEFELEELIKVRSRDFTAH